MTTAAGHVQPADLLEAQNDIADWWTSAAGNKYAVAFANDVVEKNLGKRGALPPDGTELALIQSEVLKVAVPFYIADNMVQMAEHASLTMPSQPLLKTDLPSTTGFMWLQVPYLFKDVNTNNITVKAVSWTQSETQCLVSLYSDPMDPQDQMMASHVKISAPYGMLFAGQWALEWGHDYSKIDHMLYSTVRRPEYTDEQWNTAVGNMVAMFKFILSTWTILQQFIRYQHQVVIHRAARRRLARRRREIKPIVYVTLRRLEDDGWRRDPNVEHGNVQWSHRWLVGGHWRNQWYPSLGTHRQKWIMPYEKGPEHLPLIEKDRIYILKR